MNIQRSTTYLRMHDRGQQRCFVTRNTVKIIHILAAEAEHISINEVETEIKQTNAMNPKSSAEGKSAGRFFGGKRRKSCAFVPKSCAAAGVDRRLV